MIEEGEQAEIDRDGIGIEDADEVAARVQRGHIAQADGKGPHCRFDQGGLVKFGRGWQRFSSQIDVQRAAHVGEQHGQSGGIRRHLDEVVIPLVGLDSGGNGFGQGDLRLDPDGEAVDRPGAAERIIDESGGQPPPELISRVEPLPILRERLAAATLDALIGEGRAIGADEAVRLALAEASPAADRA